MKFENYIYFKHDNCMDAFFCVEICSKDNGRRATLRGYWMTQGTAKFWPVSDRTKLNIDPANYAKWKPYDPKGEFFNGYP